jgi:hypothetical protein
MKDLLEIQEKFFNKIRKKNFGDNNLGEQVAEILDVSKSNAYKKISGKTLLSTRDYMALAGHFGISLDSLILSPTTDFMVHRQLFITDMDSLLLYLKNTAMELRRLASVPHEFYYSARDLPVFLFFGDPVLVRFKISVWLSELTEGRNFDSFYNFIPAEIFEACTEFHNGYRALNRMEIWSHSTLDNLANQINFYETIGHLPSEEAQNIRKAVVRLMDNISNQMKQSEDDKTAWRIYEVDFLMMSSNGMVITPNQTVSYVSYAGINYLRIEEEVFCMDLKHWFFKQIANSTSLVASKKNRILFFKRLKSQFED